MSAPLAVPSAATTASTWGRVRVLVLCLLYTPLSAWALVMASFGTAMVVLHRLPDPHALTFGALGAAAFKMLTLGPALVVLVSRGRSVLAVRALVLGQVVWFVDDLVAPQDHASLPELLARYAVSLVLWVGPWLALSPDRARLWRDPWPVRPLVAALAVLSALVCAPWVATIARLDASAMTSVGSMAELRYDVAGLGLAAVAALGLAAVSRAVWWDRLVAAALAWAAFACVVAPHGYGSPGYVGAVAVLPAAALLWLARPDGQRS